MIHNKSDVKRRKEKVEQQFAILPLRFGFIFALCVTFVDFVLFPFIPFADFPQVSYNITVDLKEGILQAGGQIKYASFMVFIPVFLLLIFDQAYGHTPEWRSYPGYGFQR